MPQELKIFQVDAFTNRVFGGNPAAVCVLESWLSDEQMQSIAAENNLAETAFLVPNQDGYDIRWFTPAVEVDLCGHATLASAHVLFEHYNYPKEIIHFHSHASGPLSVTRKEDQLAMDFPADTMERTTAPQGLVEAFGMIPLETFKGKTDYLLVFSNQSEIASADPDMALIARSGGRGVIISAPGEEVDFVSRFFAPQAGIDEDPVTGSAHTTLTPFWSKKLGKAKLSARQISARGGDLSCELKGDRVIIQGQAITYLEGMIRI